MSLESSAPFSLLWSGLSTDQAGALPGSSSYPSQRNGQLSLKQDETRRLAYAIKTTASLSTDFDTAAREMAALITGPCWLVPIPNSTGNTDANTRLASLIAMHCPGAQIVKAIYRTQPIASQCDRHKHALGPIPSDQHHLAAPAKP